MPVEWSEQITEELPAPRDDAPPSLRQDIAECERSCMTSQCLRGQRIGELEVLQSEIGMWSEKTTAKQRGVDWQFQIDDARQKLKRLHPQIKT